MENEKVTLENLGAGAAKQLFEVELQRVLDDILDPNTDPKAVRKVVLTVAIKPGADRSVAKVGIQATSALGKALPFMTEFFMGKGANGVEAYENNPRQMKLAFEQRLAEQQAQIHANVATLPGAAGQQ
jgi:hypothetical protein